MSDYGRRAGSDTNATTGGAGRRGTAEQERRLISDARSARHSSMGKMLLGNTITNPFTEKGELSNIAAQLKENGYMHDSGPYTKTSVFLFELMDALGFTPIEKDMLSPGIDNLKNFSLIGATNIDETIMNPNIVDPDLNLLTPVKHTATDKFKGAADAFYELDDNRPDNLKISMQETSHINLRLIARPLGDIIKKSNNKLLASPKQSSRTSGY